MTPRLTKEQAAIIGAYTGVSCGPFSHIQEYAERILDRPILTHEFAAPELWTELRAAAKGDLMNIICDEP